MRPLGVMMLWFFVLFGGAIAHAQNVSSYVYDQAGFSGFAALGYAGQSVRRESRFLSFRGRLHHISGAWAQNFSAVIDMPDHRNGGDDFLSVYEANYYLSNDLYAFIIGRINKDGGANLDQTDAFYGIGPGYQIVNRPNILWRIQAGIGQSYLENHPEGRDRATGYIASSRLVYQVNDHVVLFNDTDIVSSDNILRAGNDLGLEFAITDMFSTRASYLTKYNESQPRKNDSSLGLSVVFGF